MSADWKRTQEYGCGRVPDATFVMEMGKALNPKQFDGGQKKSDGKQPQPTQAQPE